MPEGTNTPQTPSATPDAASTAAPAKPAAPATEPTTGDQPLGDGGKKALEAEREARKELERQLSQMRDGLAQVFGQKPDGKASTDDVLHRLTEQVGTMQHDNTVYRLASEHGITDKDDIDLLRSAKDEDAMARLATRLAAKAGDGGTAPGTPKPDLTQGAKGQPVKGGTAQQFADAFKDVLN
jgi:hypothetical protein